jgi:hypothetical protein
MQEPLPLEVSEEHQREVLEECEEFLQESQQLRDIATLKSKGRTPSGRINPMAISKKLLKNATRRECRISKAVMDKDPGLW